MEELKRLEKLLLDVESCKNKEDDFDYLHTMLLAEYERYENKKGGYRNNIKQTIEKHVKDYNDALSNYGNTKHAYNMIVINFRGDIIFELGKLRTNNPSDKICQ